VRAGGGVKLAIVISLGLMAFPALAESYGDHLPARLDDTVRDTETGVRANVRYFNDVLTGGREIVVGDDGEEYELLWDGFKGVFEVTVLPGALPTESEAFVRGAVIAVCPSVDRAGLAGATIHARGSGMFQVDARCPAVDAEAGN